MHCTNYIYMKRRVGEWEKLTSQLTVWSNNQCRGTDCARGRGKVKWY